MDKPITLVEIIKEDGVKDLPYKVKGKFGQAIRAERQGDHEAAEKYLAAAIAEEQNPT